MIKKKGSTMTLTLAIIALMLMLVFALLTQVSGAYRFTLRSEIREKVIIMAESGVEKGIVALKNKLHTSPEVLPDKDATFKPESDIVFDEDGITTTVTFIQDHGKDGIDDALGQYVKITSQSVHNSTGETKRYSVYILKQNITNAYYNNLFDCALTTLDDIGNSTEKSFTMPYNKNYISIKGNTYLQGKTIDLNPYWLAISNGKLVANSGTLNTNITGTTLLSKISVSTSTLVPAAISSKVNKINPDYLPNLSVRTVDEDSSLDDGLKIFYDELADLNPLMINDLNEDYVIKVSNTNTLAIFKIIPTKANPEVFNWSAFVRHVKYYIMKVMLECPNEPYGNYYGTSYEEDYEGMYKLYLIKGDTIVSKPTDTSDYINHIIYAQGVCTIDKATSGNTSFENSAIMAKKIVINDMPGQVLYLNAPSPEGSIGAEGLSPFSSENRNIINEYCIKHLGGYTDALKFKIYKWDEN